MWPEFIGFYLLGIFVAVNNFAFWCEDRKYNRRAKRIYGEDNIVKTLKNTSIRVKLKHKFKRVIMFIGGFDSKSSDFDSLLKLLPEDILCVCPRAYGWDFVDSEFLHHAKWNEMYVYYEDIFTVLSSITDTIDVVAHSHGCNIASILASRNEINKLILLSPNFSNPKICVFIKTIFLSPFGIYLKWLFPRLPFFTESTFNSKLKGYFSLGRTSVPFNSVVEQWRCQNASLKTGIWNINSVTMVQDSNDSILGPPDEQSNIIKKHIEDKTDFYVKVQDHLYHNMVTEGTINEWLANILSE